MTVTKNNLTHIFVFYYDVDSKPSAVKYLDPVSNDWSTYLYITDLQGDVKSIIDNYNGNVAVTYEYDAWGKLISKGGDASSYPSIYAYNPFTYRGYIYDEETGFYYLQTRYYDPAIRRFINSDGQLNGGLPGYNLFSYCDNNPVIYADPRGNFCISTLALCIIGGAIIGGIAGGVVGNIIADDQGLTGLDKAQYIIAGALGGGILGGALGYMAAPFAVSATGIAGLSVTTAGVAIQYVNDLTSSTNEIVQNTCISVVPYYPPNNGFVGETVDIVLDSGTLIQRTGDLAGRFAAPAGTPLWALSLPYDKLLQSTTILEVISPIEVISGHVAPWFGQCGGGIQYLIKTGRIIDLLQEGIIKVFE